MKKIVIFGIFLMFIINIAFAQQDDKPNKQLKSGVWLKLGYVSPSSTFLYETITNGNKMPPQYGINFQFGTTFYTYRFDENMRLGIDVSWIDFSNVQFKTNDIQPHGQAYFLNAFGVGPMLSVCSKVAPMAYDFYCRVSPNVYVIEADFDFRSIGGGRPGEERVGFYNVVGILGTSYRYKKLSVGLEYNFQIENNVYMEDDQGLSHKYNLNINNAKLFVGLKF